MKEFFDKKKILLFHPNFNFILTNFNQLKTAFKCFKVDQTHPLLIFFSPFVTEILITWPFPLFFQYKFYKNILLSSLYSFLILMKVRLLCLSHFWISSPPSKRTYKLKYYLKSLLQWNLHLLSFSPPWSFIVNIIVLDITKFTWYKFWPALYLCILTYYVQSFNRDVRVSWPHHSCT